MTDKPKKTKQRAVGPQVYARSLAVVELSYVNSRKASEMCAPDMLAPGHDHVQCRLPLFRIGEDSEDLALTLGRGDFIESIKIKPKSTNGIRFGPGAAVLPKGNQFRSLQEHLLERAQSPLGESVQRDVERDDVRLPLAKPSQIV